MIKVLHVFGTLSRGGAEMRTMELMPVLKNKGYHFDFCTVNNPVQRGALEDRVGECGGQVFSCPITTNLFSFCIRFVKLLKKNKYDVVHSHIHYTSGIIVCLARLAGVSKRIVHFRSTYDGGGNGLLRIISKKIRLKMADYTATDVLAVCEGALDSAWGSDWRSDTRARVLYNGLDRSAYVFDGTERQAVLEELSLLENCKLVIHVGRFTPAKAHDVLIDAAAKFITKNTDIHLLLVGIGNLKESMSQKALEYGIADNVHFLGLRNDVPKLLKASDCMVLSSRWEGLPGVVLEALAADLPVIATDLPGVREIAQHTTMINIVPVGNSEYLANEVGLFFENSDVRDESKCVFPAVFDLQKCATELASIYGK